MTSAGLLRPWSSLPRRLCSMVLCHTQGSVTADCGSAAQQGNINKGTDAGQAGLEKQHQEELKVRGRPVVKTPNASAEGGWDREEPTELA